MLDPRFSEQVHVQDIDSMHRGFAELDERWNNRLTGENLCISEEYIKARLTVALDLELSAGAEAMYGAGPAHFERAVFNQRAIVCYSVDTRDGGSLNDRNNKSVLVNIVKLVQSPNKPIAVRSLESLF